MEVFKEYYDFLGDPDKTEQKYFKESFKIQVDKDHKKYMTLTWDVFPDLELDKKNKNA